MSKKIYLFILSFLAFVKVGAQEFSLEYGVIADAEWEMKSYEKDPEAGAVVLYDIGKTLFETDKNGETLIKLFRKKRIKIFDRTELKVADISIPLYHSIDNKFEKIIDLEAFTYSRDGDRVIKKQVQAESIFEEKIDDFWSVKKFTFPDVQEGSILEYTYILESPNIFNLPDWEFQSTIPTIYSEYKIGMIPFYEYVFMAQGIDSFDIKTVEKDKIWKKFGQIKSASGQNLGEAATYNDMNYTYVMKDVEAFKDELYITTVNDYIAKIDFQLSNTYQVPRNISDRYQTLGQVTEFMTTWPKLVEDFLEYDYFGKYLEESENIAKKVIKSELALEGKTKTQQAKLIIDYVKNNYEWDQYYRKQTSKRPKDLVAEKTGNSAEINLFLTAMLRAADIEAKPVILSTRDHGKLKLDYPFQHLFNYVVTLVIVENITYLTDATDPLIAYNRIPPRCINGQGLIVDQENVGWVRLDSKILSINNRLFTIAIDQKNLIAEAGVTIQASEYDAYEYKSALGEDPEAVEKAMLDKGFKSIDQVRFINFDKNEKPLVIAFKGTADVEELGGKLVLYPFFEFPLKKNGLIQKERKYPIDLIYANSKNYKAQINIPEGYTLKNIPEGIDIKDEFASIKLEYKLVGNQLIIEGSYTFYKAVFEPKEYSKVKNYFDIIVDKFNQEIIFDPL